MVIVMKDSLNKVWNMEKELNYTEMEIFIRANLWMVYHKGMESIHGLMEASLKGIFNKGNVVDTEFGRQEKIVLSPIKGIFI